MKFKTFLICLTLFPFSELVNAQGYGGDYNPGRRNNQQQSYSPSSGPTGYVSVNAGFSSVGGSWNFATPQFNSQYFGYGENYAQGGSFENITAGIPINGSNFGVALMLGFGDNPFDASDFFANAVSAQYPNANPNTAYYTPNYSGDYETVNLMAGVFYTYPIGRFSIDLRGMLGYISCRLPAVGYSFYQNGTPFDLEDDYDISSSTAHALAYDVGAGLRYSFRGYYCLMLNFDYLGASLPFSTDVTQSSYDQNGNLSGAYVYNDSGTLPLSLFNISLGLGFQFGR